MFWAETVGAERGGIKRGRRTDRESEEEGVIKENQDVSSVIPTGLAWASAPQSSLIGGKGLFEEEVKTISTC